VKEDALRNGYNPLTIVKEKLDELRNKLVDTLLKQLKKCPLNKV
jgi:hypothetical protein